MILCDGGGGGEGEVTMWIIDDDYGFDHALGFSYPVVPKGKVCLTSLIIVTMRVNDHDDTENMKLVRTRITITHEGK